MLKAGDKVRYTGESKWDLTNGKVYVVSVGSYDEFSVIDDVGDENGLIYGDYELVTDEPENVNYAELAAKCGIVITIEFADGNVIVFDGKK